MFQQWILICCMRLGMFACVLCASHERIDSSCLIHCMIFMLLNCFVSRTIFDNSFRRENIEFNQNSYLKIAFVFKTDPKRTQRTVFQLAKCLHWCPISSFCNEISCSEPSRSLVVTEQFYWNCENSNKIHAHAISFTICLFWAYQLLLLLFYWHHSNSFSGKTKQNLEWIWF